MSNPLYEQFGKANMQAQFNQFKNNFKGDPQQIIQQMLNSGRITQEQLNQAMQKANQLKEMLGIK